MREANGHVIRALCPRCLTPVLGGPLIGLGRLFECRDCPGQAVVYQADGGGWEWVRWVYPWRTPDALPAIGPDKPLSSYTRTRPVRDTEDIRAMCTECLRPVPPIVGPYRRTYRCKSHPEAPCLIVEGDRAGKPDKHGFTKAFLGNGYRDTHRESRVGYVAAGDWSMHATRPLQVRDLICSDCHRSIFGRAVEIQPGRFYHDPKCPTEEPSCTSASSAGGSAGLALPNARPSMSPAAHGRTSATARSPNRRDLHRPGSSETKDTRTKSSR